MHQGEVPDAVDTAVHASSRKASTRRANCASLCAAVSDTRRRALPLGHGRRPDGRYPQAAFVERAGDAQGFVVVADDHRLNGRR
jgi:hypothetical protein